jgi:hypothetical protein
VQVATIRERTAEGLAIRCTEGMQLMALLLITLIPPSQVTAGMVMGVSDLFVDLSKDCNIDVIVQRYATSTSARERPSTTARLF